MNAHSLTPLDAEDIPALRAIVDREGRNISREELDRFFSLEGAGGWAIRENDRLIGAVTTLRMFEHGVLGPLISEQELPDGFELVLLGHAIESLQKAGVVRVEVEAAARESDVLMRMGFHRVRGTLILERAAAKLDDAEPMASLEARHYLDLGMLDAAAVGHGRKGFLMDVHHQFPEGSVVEEHDGEMVGYALLRRSRRGYHLGPLVTGNSDAALAERLLRAAVSRVATWPIVALAPEGSELLPALEALGFRVVGSLDRLRAGETPEAPVSQEWLVGSRMTG